MNPSKGGWLIPLSLLVAMALRIAPLPGEAPEWVGWLRPDWAVALFFYWTLTMPGRTGLFTAWLAGLLFDALLGGSYPLGLHGAGFAFTVFAATALRTRLQMNNSYQQAAIVAAIVLAVQLFQGLVRFVTVDVDFSISIALSALVTLLVYPLLALLLQGPVERFATDERTRRPSA